VLLGIGIATARDRESIGDDASSFEQSELRIVLKGGIRTFDDKVDSREGNSPEPFIRSLKPT